MPTTQTKSQETAADVSALLRARNPLLWVVTREEARVERYLVEAAAAAGYVPRTWDVAQGVANLAGDVEFAETQDPGAALSLIQQRAREENSSKQQRGAWILRDIPVWLAGQTGAAPQRQLRNLARLLPGTPRETAQAVVVLSPSGEVPAELAGHATVIQWPLPDRAEIADIVDGTINALPEFETDPKTKKPDPTKPLRALAAPNGTRDAAIDAAVGLSGEEAQACFARSLVQLRKIDPATVSNEKKRIIAREGVLEWYDPIAGGLDAVGGLDSLKSWLIQRRTAYSPAARAYGLPTPKGVFLVGISGCGKSLIAKAIATAWQVPLLRVDLGALKSKFVGDSEANLRKVFKVIEAIGRCVVWFDEVEKALQGATSGSADGGVSSDALGAVLSWMQERQGEAFVVATANDVSALPPELLRKGRFDELFWVDLPNGEEREAIVAAALRSHGRAKVAVDFGAVSKATEEFTGSEIAALVPDALFTAFNDDAREITTADLLAAARNVTPLAKTAADKIKAMREQAKGKFRPATSPATVKAEQAQSRGRALDL